MGFRSRCGWVALMGDCEARAWMSWRSSIDTDRSGVSYSGSIGSERWCSLALLTVDVGMSVPIGGWLIGLVLRAVFGWFRLVLLVFWFHDGGCICCAAMVEVADSAWVVVEGGWPVECSSGLIKI